MPKTSVINLKTDPKLKKEAQELADRLGVSLSQVLNSSLRQFIATRQFSVVEDYTPSAELKKIIKNSQKPSRKVSFDSRKEALDFLDSL